MNISSIVVQTKPEFLAKVIEDLKNSGVCDYHLHDEKGRIIVTIEGDGVKEELAKLKVIEQIEHVAAADMHMAYSENELEQNMKLMNGTDIVPEVLAREDIDPSHIIYNGDLKKKDDLESFADQLDRASR